MNEIAKQQLTALAASLHLDACGVAAAEADEVLREKLMEAGNIPFAPPAEERLSPETLLPGAKSFFVILFPYKIAEPEGGNIALYARAPDYHHVIHTYLDKLISTIQELYPAESFRPLVDTSPMVDRYLAYRAGLGFFGRNHCLIHPVYGSYVTIGSILTTLDLPADKPLDLTCGTCRKCLSRCPGHVLGVTPFNPWRCKSYLTQKKEALTEEETRIVASTPYIFGCDECQRCCPYNEKAPPSPLPEIHEHRIPTLTRDMLTSISNRAFDKIYRPYAFAWRGKKVLLRNLDITEKRQ